MSWATPTTPQTFPSTSRRVVTFISRLRTRPYFVVSGNSSLELFPCQRLLPGLLAHLLDQRRYHATSAFPSSTAAGRVLV